MGIEPRLEIVEKKSPLLHAPQTRRFVAVEADHESRDEIEFLPEIRQPDKGPNPPNDAAEPEQHYHFAEHRYVVDVEAEGVMPEEVGDEKEIARPAPEIEDALAKTAVETELANAAQVFRHPSWQIKIFGPRIFGFGTGITPANRFKLLRIDRLDEVFRFQISVEPSSKHESVGVSASALQRSTILKLADLLREAHWVADLVRLTLRILAGSVLSRNVISLSSRET